MGYKDDAFNYCVLSVPNSKPLIGPPQYLILHPPSSDNENRKSSSKSLLLRGDCDSKLTIWNIPHVTSNQIMQLKQMAFGEEGVDESVQKVMQPNFQPPEMPPKCVASLQQAWDNLKPSPPGILDQFVSFYFCNIKEP